MSLPVIQLAQMPADFLAIRQIRYQVFQVEQGVPEHLEFDGQDDQAEHLLAYLQGVPVGTTRLRLLSPNRAKIERLAVLPQGRGQGIGRRLMEVALAHLEAKAVAEVVLHAQAHLETFYSTLGFVPQGGIFEEAGIPHVKMGRRLQ